ncbi:hypothetical protein [Nonomuraea sp. 10N515B]|uniref:hypothetical protein n=1 Tax=Nonomuraea sp. 10N515B TaxID=3457422 RepID=UPI003FCEB3A6
MLLKAKENPDVGKHEDPKSPKDQPFKADPSRATPDGHRESGGKHADDKGKDGKK